MSFFSEKLREAVANSGMSIASISELSGISSAMLYKIQSGNRLPESLEKLNTLLDVLHCSLPAKRQIIKEYMVCRIGYHQYHSFGELKAMLSQFTAVLEVASPISYDENIPIPPVTVGENNVNMLIQRLIDVETQKENGSIGMFVDLQYEHCFRCLSQSLSHAREDFGFVTHLFCLKATASDEAILHNMKIFRSVLPQMVSMGHYEPMYCYLPDSNDGTVPFPYFIITTGGVLLISGELDSCVYLTDPSVRQLFVQRFILMKENFSPCMQSGNPSMETYFYGFHEIIGRHNLKQKAVILASLPCVLPCISAEQAMSYLPAEMLQDQRLQSIAAEYFVGAATNGYETFFTLEGLEHLINTGEIMELQGEFVPRAKQEDILEGLEEFVRRCRSGIITPHVFKTNMIPADTRFSMTLNGKNLMLYCEASCRNTVFVNFAESTMATVVTEYVANAELLGDVFTPEESLSLVEKTLRKYRK